MGLILALLGGLFLGLGSIPLSNKKLKRLKRSLEGYSNRNQNLLENYESKEKELRTLVDEVYDLRTKLNDKDWEIESKEQSLNSMHIELRNMSWNHEDEISRYKDKIEEMQKDAEVFMKEGIKKLYPLLGNVVYFEYENNIYNGRLMEITFQNDEPAFVISVLGRKQNGDYLNPKYKTNYTKVFRPMIYASLEDAREALIEKHKLKIKYLEAIGYEEEDTSSDSRGDSSY